MSSQIEIDDIHVNKVWNNGECMPRFKCFSAVTDAQGKFTIDYSNENYASVVLVLPNVVHNAASAADEYIVTIHSFDNNSCSGAVISIGDLAVAPQYVAADVDVKILVLSDPNA